MNVQDEIARLQEEIKALKAAVRNVPLRPASGGGGGGVIIHVAESENELPQNLMPPQLAYIKSENTENGRYFHLTVARAGFGQQASGYVWKPWNVIR